MKKINEIWVIEDDPITSMLLRKLIERGQFANITVAFHNGKLPIQQMRKRRDEGQPFPDLIMLDINMPVMDGWEFLDYFVEEFSNSSLPIVIMTSSIDTNDVKKSKAYSCIKGYYYKPVTMDNFNEIISGV
ncbi:MAG: response regulator [Flavobacteriales bacterium]